MTTESDNTAISEDNRRYRYDGWVDFMRKTDGFIPDHIYFRAAPGAEITKKETWAASLDELAAAIVWQVQFIKDQRSVANGLKEIQKLVRDSAHLPGHTTIGEALFPKSGEESPEVKPSKPR